jgi:hypothetical protein
MYGIYAMAASGRMQYDYKQTNKPEGRGKNTVKVQNIRREDILYYHRRFGLHV